jgi:peptidoglycan/LPS O-acetylase OafA/YrhL
MRSDNKGRVLGLDILRASAILMVVIGHAVAIIAPLKEASGITGAIARKLIPLTSPFGLIGVELFFALSGYLIGNILINQFLRDKFDFAAVKHFWARRWFRTLPNYYIVLILLTIFYFYRYQIVFDWRFFIFSQNLVSPHPDYFGEAWSLCIEEWFYLLLPVWILLCAALLRNRSRKDILFYSFLSYLAVTLAIRMINAFQPYYPEQDTGIRKIVLFRLDAVMYGVIIAYCKAFHAAWLDKNKGKLFVAGIAGLLAALAIRYVKGVTGTDLYESNTVFRFVSDAFLFALLPFSFALLVPLAATIKTSKYKAANRIITHISLISYSMYLIHYSLILGPFFSELKTKSTAMLLVILGLYLALVVLASSALYYFFERPVLKLRDKVTLRKAQQPTQPTENSK